MQIIGIIPARYASTRFPGKPLVKIDGKSMIQRVYEQAAKAIDTVYIATDDKRIADEITSFGGNFVMTDTDHASGTDRLNEAVQIIEKQLNSKFDVIINIQGDEPFINPEQIEQIISCFEDQTTEIATLVKKIDSQADIFNPNKPKVVFNKNMNALLFSRSPIPYIRGCEEKNWTEKHTFFKHIGMYAYKRNILNKITKLKQSELEIAESLEQLRWLENGYKIKVAITDIETIGIDTPDDLKRLKLI